MKAKQEQKGRVGIVAYIEFDHVSKLYGTSEVPVRALDDVSFSMQKGEFCVLLGSSGAGKTTLLNLLGGMDTVTSGSIFVDGSEVSALNDRRLVDYRRHDVGFVFQFYNLIPNLTALENIEIAAQLCKDPIDAMAALSLVGLKDRGGHFPAQLSGGEQQRVAIARALAKNPKLLLCDEPTGALDYETGKGILKLLHRLSREHHTTVMIIFKNDISIVSGIADLFPLFFALIAMLVCVTTMTRMVEEERTQIGTLKALGFSTAEISAKYLLYAGSAALIGWAGGYFAGTLLIPKVFWLALSSVYGFARIQYTSSLPLAVMTGLVSITGILLCTWLSVRSELSIRPAELIRPGVSKSGKRIWLEQITPFWKRLSFLHKITLRNMLRYKQRLFMMLVGISCCAALVLTGFGVKDSLIGITDLQYKTIQRYQLEATVTSSKIDDVTDRLFRIAADSAACSCSLSRVSVKAHKSSMSAINLYSTDQPETFMSFWTLKTADKACLFPPSGEVLVCTKIAQKLSLSVGDTLIIRDAARQDITATVSGIFDNYLDNALILNADTLRKQTGEWKPDTLLIRTSGTQTTAKDASSEAADAALAQQIAGIPGVRQVSRLSLSKETADKALSCVYYIVLLLILFSGALELIVIYNLTSINLAERSREIATVEVLGFYPKETDSYVLRENLILSLIASFIGLPLGMLFHRAVMSRILVDNMVFLTRIRSVSYILAVLITNLFAYMVNLLMRKRIRAIPMAESLKAVE